MLYLAAVQRRRRPAHYALAPVPLSSVYRVMWKQSGSSLNPGSVRADSILAWARIVSV